MTTGKRIKKYRDEHGLTQGEIAELVGCSSASVSQWESGASMLGVSMLAIETVLSLDDPRDTLIRVRAGEATAAQKKMTDLLVENAQLRSNLERWETWAKGTLALMKGAS